MRLAEHHHSLAAPAVAWEECSCLLCGHSSHTPRMEASDRYSGLRFLLVTCDRCGLCFTNPRPDPVSSQRFYPADYRCHRGKDRLSKTGALIEGHGRLLDFGC